MFSFCILLAKYLLSQLWILNTADSKIQKFEEIAKEQLSLILDNLYIQFEENEGITTPEVQSYSVDKKIEKS